MYPDLAKEVVLGEDHGGCGVQDVIDRIKKAPVEHILDSIMYLSGNDSKFIRTTAFSTLSSLSKYSSQCKSVMAQVQRDIEIPETMQGKDYMQFLHDRLAGQRTVFNEQHAHAGVVTKFSGLYSLLRLSQEPTAEEIDEASARYIEFIKQPYNLEDKDHLRNEAYFIKVF